MKSIVKKKTDYDQFSDSESDYKSESFQAEAGAAVPACPLIFATSNATFFDPADEARCFFPSEGVGESTRKSLFITKVFFEESWIGHIPEHGFSKVCASFNLQILDNSCKDDARHDGLAIVGGKS